MSFSFLPIRMISIASLILGLVSFFYGIFVIYAKLTGLVLLQGWTAIMVVLLFISSSQMIALGIIGEYVWRAMDAASNRSNFLVENAFL